jgi:hypothetical protein
VSASSFGLLAAIERLGKLAASRIARILWTALSLSLAFASLAGWMALALVALGTSVPGRSPRAGAHRPRAGEGSCGAATRSVRLNASRTPLT